LLLPDAEDNFIKRRIKIQLSRIFEKQNYIFFCFISVLILRFDILFQISNFVQHLLIIEIN